MTPFHSSSGEPGVDRRADYAEMLLAEGAPAAAAEVLLGALDITPGWAYGWFRVGEMFEAAGDTGQAAMAYEMSAQLDSDDRLGATLKLAIMRGETPERVPPAFVEMLFDQYAPSFDAALVDKLGYRVPDLLSAAIEKASPGRHFKRVLDVGCGTGLMGMQLRARCDFLEGMDISRGMLGKARARNVYDNLEKADLSAFSVQPGSFDLIVAADVFMYVADLAQVFDRCRAALENGGVFAFSVERADSGVVLRESRRFAHGLDIVQRLLSEKGLACVSVDREVIRHDRGEALEGLVFVARR